MPSCRQSMTASWDRRFAFGTYICLYGSGRHESPKLGRTHPCPAHVRLLWDWSNGPPEYFSHHLWESPVRQLYLYPKLGDWHRTVMSWWQLLESWKAREYIPLAVNSRCHQHCERIGSHEQLYRSIKESRETCFFYVPNNLHKFPWGSNKMLK